MKISKVKLKENGRAGLVVTYTSTDKRDGMEYIIDTNRTYRAPVNKELARAVEALRKHLLEVCMIANEIPEEVSVTGVSSNGEWFIISGKVTTYGKKVFAVNTPKMDDDGEYGHFDEVMDKVRKVFEEVAVYVLQKKVADKKQIALDFITADAVKMDVAVDLESFNGMSDEELDNYCREHLEKRGAIVIQERTEEVVEQSKVIQMAPNANVEIPSKRKVLGN